MKPTWRPLAPVNAPRSWPNNWLASNSAGTAPQLTQIIGPRRPLRAWMACATSSLPVPVSPSTSTFKSLRATCAMSALTRCIGALSPTSSWSSPAWPRRRCWKSVRTCSNSCSRALAATGLPRKPLAGLATARRICSASPVPETNTICPWRLQGMRSSTSRPVPSGKAMSRIINSAWLWLSQKVASATLWNCRGRKPSSLAMRATRVEKSGSSSTMASIGLLTFVSCAAASDARRRRVTHASGAGARI